MLKASQRLVNKNSLTWWYVLKISLLDVLKIYLSYLQNVLKTSWRCLEDIFQDVLARRLEDVLKKFWRRLQNVLKMSSRCLGDVFARSLEDVLKTSWRRLQDVFWRRKAKANISVLIKTSWRRLQDVFWRRRRKTSSRRPHQDECLLGSNFLPGAAQFYWNLTLTTSNIAKRTAAS